MTLKNKRKPTLKALLTAAVFCLPLLFTMPCFSKEQSSTVQETYKNLEMFSNVLSIIQQNYVEPIDTQDVIEGAIRGMLMTLDPHSSFMNPDDFKELQVETKGSFSGIGIEITIKDGILTVVSPIEGTPAYEKGIKAGDKIIKIENEPTKDMSLMDAVKRLRGFKGTPVTISVHRQGWTELQEITIIRDVIPIHSVKAKILEPGFAYVRITNFQSQTSKDLKKSLKSLTKETEIKGLILDLRNNPGGLLDQSVKISDLFLEEGLIVFTKGRHTNQDMEFKAHSTGTLYSFPIVVLVNEGSASASEIVAGALQDNKRALVLGTQTFGKGSVQTIIPMNDGAGLRLTTARYYTPSGVSIQAKGITPDIIIPFKPVNGDEEVETKQPKFLREKDLKRHMENDNELKNGDAEKKEENDTGEEEKKADEIKKDNQLYTALLILKSLNVLSVVTGN